MTDSKVKVLRVRCPQCGTLTPWKDNPDRPFCSERCRTLDLGNWAEENYRMPGEPAPQDPEGYE
ncbi:MAG: DNA gyrase inhibitor YacG [Desulfuromonas sp.]|nr:MAG: DNA gyrase inhibitor YacG [Desulfuromonas sp.]